MTIEPLEARIAPATIVHGVLRYIDVDGDQVTVTTTGTTASLSPSNLTFDTAFAESGPQQLRVIDLSGTAFTGANLTITVAHRAGGDGFANLGYIKASGVNLGTVTVPGDLGKIVAGNGTGTALKTLSVHSLGVFGTSTGAPDLTSLITGALGALRVAGDVKEAVLQVSGLGGHNSDGKLGSVTIGGSLIGGAGNSNGGIGSTGDTGPVKIGQNLEGGAGIFSGYINVVGKIASLTIGGSVLGGGISSGQVFAKSIGPVKIGHDVKGGVGSSSGVISASGKLSTVTIGGSLLGGAGSDSGQVASFGDIGLVKIGGSVRGGAGKDSGKITSDGKLAGVSVGGSLVGGAGIGSGWIVSAGDLGPVAIRGDVRGGAVSTSGVISGTSGLAGVSIGGSLLGGAGESTGAIIATGALGPVKIGGDVVGSGGRTSGVVFGRVKAVGVSVGGSLVGGTGENSGEISSLGAIGAVAIGGDVRGADANGIILLDSGVIKGLRLASVTLGGSLIAGRTSAGGTLTGSGAIVATDDLGSIVVKGSLLGNENNHASIFARGQAVPTATTDVAIHSVTVGGRVEFGWIFGGVNQFGVASNGNAQIGSVSVGGDWLASSLESGSTSTDGFIGDANDATFNGGTLARIASIVIGGAVVGEPGTTKTSGFFSGQIGAFKTGGVSFPLKPGAHNDIFALGAELRVGASLSSVNTDQFAVHVFEV